MITLGTGQMNLSVAEVMMEAGKALNLTFGAGTEIAQITQASGACSVGMFYTFSPPFFYLFIV